MSDNTIKLGFLIQNRTYCEAVMYAMQSRCGFKVRQHPNNLPSQELDEIGENTDVLVCDAKIESLLPLLHQLKHLEKYPRFILVLHSVIDYQVDKFISTGIHGFVSIDEGLDKLEHCITEVHSGRLVYPSEITQRFLSTLTSTDRYNTNIRGSTKILTPRQIGVLKLMEVGYSNKEIARKLGIELATVKNHVHQILEKYDAKSRNEAVAFYRRSNDYQFSGMPM